MIEDDAQELSTARTSAILGIAALTMMASMCCTSFMGIMGGMVVGLIGLWLAFTQRELDMGPASTAFHQVGLATNGIASGLGCLFTLGIAAYMALYVALFAVMIATGP
ncbi:MAG: hypothetical protein EP330_24995 [Deltaproteobacteria bacterium]|nr:MAG: hypothetical protein EP330_24995 [Deltaproteobacteria bacterium]